MSMCRVFSCVVGRGCLLWPVHFLCKTLLVFALLHSIFQGQICLLLQVFLDFLLLHSRITPTIVILFFSQWHYPSRMTWNSEVSKQMSLSSQIDIKKLIEFIIWSLGPPSELHCSRVYSFKIHFKQSLLFGSPAHKMIESTNQQLFY